MALFGIYLSDKPRPHIHKHQQINGCVCWYVHHFQNDNIKMHGEKGGFNHLQHFCLYDSMWFSILWLCCNVFFLDSRDKHHIPSSDIVEFMTKSWKFESHMLTHRTKLYSYIIDDAIHSGLQFNWLEETVFIFDGYLYLWDDTCTRFIYIYARITIHFVCAVPSS